MSVEALTGELSSLRLDKPQLTCFRCFSSQHPTQRCHLPEGLTPYQGSRRCFGDYRCTCGRSWKSSNSWKDAYQNCQRCHSDVYPHKQRPLNKPDGLDKSDVTRPHPQQHCSKCRELGHYCREQRTYDDDDVEYYLSMHPEERDEDDVDSYSDFDHYEDPCDRYDSVERDDDPYDGYDSNGYDHDLDRFDFD